ncbi:hypothetical protein SLEP1_g12715 [Rubroshorea leprosula]|uniref:Uncharacterized protein n=1 Tax=Rubroshorea leprosula TaxID=152421 RepID=A0AAV5IDE6_9ROSI|nr:hypothetical protein SLEP1_g12715 [Rubroshorea leprosula]
MGLCLIAIKLHILIQGEGCKGEICRWQRMTTSSTGCGGEWCRTWQNKF